MSEQLRLMAVHAHPDDESSKGAATMARYVAEGADVMVVTCTGGERGDVLNPKLDRPEVWANIGEIRRKEMDRAREIIGFRQRWLGFVDSGMPADELPEGCFAIQPLELATEPLVAIMREFRPHVVLTYDENGGYPHPDHIMCHKVSAAAFEASGDPSLHPDSGEPWQPLKLYYHMSMSRSRIVAFHEALIEAGRESPFAEWVGTFKQSDVDEVAARVTTRIECADYYELRDDALRAHETQVDPEGMWFAVPMEMQRKNWSTEDYQLARSLVDIATPEDDLFAGIREKVVA